MNALALLAETEKAGISLAATERGTLKYSGDQDALERLLPEIRTHKAAILAALAANDAEPVINHRLWWILHGPDDWRLHSVTPPSPLAEVQGWYPGCTVEVEPETIPLADMDGRAKP